VNGTDKAINKTISLFYNLQKQTAGIDNKGLRRDFRDDLAELTAKIKNLGYWLESHDPVVRALASDALRALGIKT